MLTFWPSFSLLVFFLVIFLECRAIGGRVTLPLGSFLMVFCYGAIGAPLLALLLQQIPFFPDAGIDPASPIAWLIGPPVEELAKALPVIVLAFLTRESRRLSIADLTLIGFASGAGFGFVEGNLNALVNGTLPSVQHLTAFGLQTQAGAVFFAGHPVATALVGLAAGIGLRFLPPNVAYAWVPSALVILWASFDHGIYNWKLLLAGNSGVLPEAHFVVEFLHLLTLNGQLQTWLLPIGLIVAQLFEAHLCSKAVGARRDLMLAREWRPWVINEWLVALIRAPLGRAAFAQTLGYFRLRRAFYLATFEARRDAKDPTLSRHARSLEDRLKRERSILFDPPRGTWLLPLPVLKTYAAQWTWRMRWVLVFAVLLLFLFMLDPAGLPDWLRQFLFGEIFTAFVVVAGVAFTVWRIVLFARLPPPDPLAAEGAACAGYYTRALLLGCALICGMFPTLALLLGWKAFAPGAAFISGYLPGWIAQGGNLQTLLGLGTIGAAVAPDPRPAGEALRHEIAAADDRMRRLGSEIAERVGAPDDSALSGTVPPVRLEAFLDTMAKLDVERDAQARRQIALDECARQAAESTIRDPAPAVQAVKDEFDRLAAELLESAAKELDAIAALEQTYGRAWIEIMQDLDAHDTLRRRLRTPLRAAWQAQNEIDWALRVAEATDECLLPMQLTLLPELDALATTTHSERAALVVEGIERIRAAADHYGAADPFDFAVGTNPDDEDEAALLAEFASAVPSAEAPKSFGLRAPQPSEEPAVPDEDESASASEPEAVPPAPAQPRAQHYQEALDQLIDTTRHDQAYLDTIRHLELSDDPAESGIELPAPARHYPSERAETLPTVAPPQEPAGEVEDLIDAIKRDSGYLAFAKGPPAQDDRDQPEQTDSTHAADDAPAPVQTAHDFIDEREDTAPDVGETEPASVAQEFDTIEHVDVALTANDAPAPEIVQAADHTSDVVESDAQSVADAVDPETAAAQGLDTAEHTDLAEPSGAHLPDMQAGEHDAVETAPQAADEQVPQPVIEDIYLDDIAISATIDAPASPQYNVSHQSASPGLDDLVILDVESRAGSDEPLPTDAPREGDAHADAFEQEPATRAAAETIAPAPAEEPVIEPYRPAEVETPGAPEELPARTEIRSSLFARLFQSIRRQSADSPARPTSRDGWAQQPEAARAPTEQAPSVTISSIDESANTAHADQRDLDLEKISNETIAPASPWLADLASPAADGETAKPDDLSLEPIEWHDHAGAPEIANAAEIAERAETAAGEAPDASSGAAASEAATFDFESVHAAEHEAPTDDTVALSQPIESASSDAAPDETADSDIAQTAGDPTAAAPDAIESAPQQVDEFSSKADRLSYLLAKLEGAIQAKTAAVAASRKEDVETAPREPDQSALPAQSAQAKDPELSLVEVTAITDAEPATPATLEPSPQTNAGEESAALIVEAPAAAVEPSDAPSDATARTHDGYAPDSAVEQTEPDVQPEEAQSVQLKPDRLSYLLTKLFESAKRQSPEPASKPEDTGDTEPPTIPASAAAEEHADDILDLRLPDADRAEPDDVQEIEFGTLREEQTEPQAAIEHQAHVEAPRSAPAALTESVEAPAPPELPVIDVAPPVDALPMPASEAASENTDLSESKRPAASTPSEAPTEPAARPRLAEPAPLFGTPRSRRPRPAAPIPQAETKPVPEAAPAPAIELKPAAPERTPEPSRNDAPAGVPRRDWKLAANGPRGDHPNAEDHADAAGAAKKSEPTLRLKTGSGALATVDTPPPGSPVAAEKMPAKYYGPKHAKGEDDETGTVSPAQQRALSLADALTEYYAKAGQPQPPMHTTDRATLQRIIANGKLEAPRRRGAPWSISGMSRRGEVAIRLKPGADQFVEFVPSTEIFGQVPHYYPRGVGKGSYATHIPAGHLEHFDLATRQWAPVQRG